MESILSDSNRQVLNHFLKTRVLVAFDYDGTLAPIVSDPKKAKMRAKTRKLLRELALRVPCVVISGRARNETRQFLGSIPIKEVIGNHGIEPWKSSKKIKSQVARLKKELQTKLPKLLGVAIEDKVYSLSVHYRQSRTKKKARASILTAAEQLPHVRIIKGKQVINIVPEDGPHKGIALLKAMRKLRCDTSIYVGDDATDEDVFSLDLPGQILSVSVGAKLNSSARYFLRNQLAMDTFLKSLLLFTKTVR